MTSFVAGAAGPALEAIRAAVAAAPVAHFDETGFRVAARGRLSCIPQPTARVRPLACRQFFH